MSRRIVRELTNLRILAATFVVWGSVAGRSLPAQDRTGGWLYWIDIGTAKIQRARPDGEGIEDVVTGLNSTLHLAIDAVNGRIYWTDMEDEITGSIRRAALDGTGVEPVLFRPGMIGGIALDPGREKIYYGGVTSRGEGGILRAGLDGSGEEEVTYLQDVDGIALDLLRDRIFQLDRCDDFIFLHRFGSPDVETLVEEAWGMAFDAPGDQLYWLGVAGGVPGVHRMAVAGDALPERVAADSSYTSGLALDIGEGKVYWGDRSGGRIRRSDFAGGGIEDVRAGLSQPFAMAFYPGSAPSKFLRGDTDGDSNVDLSDAVAVLGHLFLGNTELHCLDAADADDSGNVEITDAIFLLSALFLGTKTIPAPYPDCGVDPTADQLGCGKGCQ